jgi:LmbE family N-acetylglucosaminyl deacetylase
VFAPHPDDETLGCGGTIIKKKRLGAPLQVVFLTDGTQSPRNVPAAKLKPLREQEALEACRTLGVEQHCVSFFGFEDGTLAARVPEAREQVTQFLLRHRAEQIFVPYRRDFDPGLDHPATRQIVLSALCTLKSPVTLFEYPIWFWRHWPWSKMLVQGPPRRWRALKHTRLVNWGSLLGFRHCVAVDDVLELKKAALVKHASQVSGLARIQSSDFVKWFFGSQEVFCRRTTSVQR